MDCANPYDAPRSPLGGAKSSSILGLKGPDYGLVALVAFAALACELFFGFPFFFAPGWANGWPGGLTIHRVWSFAMTTYLFVVMMTIGIGVGGFVGVLLGLFLGGRRTELIFFAWLLLWTVLTTLTCIFSYRQIYDSTLEMWPNGYPNIG